MKRPYTSNKGKWDTWYRGLVIQASYGGGDTYHKGADWLADCATVEDWGCGKGFMLSLIGLKRYRGVDGSETPFAHVTADLVLYRSHVEGIFIRHVLEHDWKWHCILKNAVASFTRRMALVIFTPFGPKTQEIGYNKALDVPDISFNLWDILQRFKGLDVHAETLVTATQYGTETIFYVERV